MTSVRQPANPPTVVLLHGFPQGGAMLDPLANQLRGMGLTVFVPTLPGYDVSWPLLPRHAYSFRRLAECVQKQLAEQRITSYVVVGHDLGAAIGIQLAGDSRCHGVVSIALPHPAAFLQSLLRSTQAFRAWYFVVAQSTWLSGVLFSPWRKRSRQRLIRMLKWNGMSDSTAQSAARLLAKTGLAGPLRWYQAMPFSPLKDMYTRVEKPWLIIAGAEDNLCHPLTFELSTAFGSNAKLVTLSSVGHWITEATAKEIAAAVVRCTPMARAIWL